MAVAVEAPKLGNTVEECVVSRWVKRRGDAVSAGEVVAEIETDKATFEVNAPVDGMVLETFFEEGAVVPVFTNLFVVGEAGEDVETFRPGTAPSGRGSVTGSQGAVTGSQGREFTERVAGFSPRARRFADEHDFHPASVVGSGPGGRVLEEDLRALFESAPARSNVRDTIARRMRESLATTAQYTLHAWADASGLLRVRASIKASAGASDINIHELVAYCTIQALRRMPELNAEYIDGATRQRAEVHLGFACDTPRGLIVPVVRNANTLAIGELSFTMKELAARAVGGKLSADDMSGGTFTISNLGNLGITSFTPLVNPPQVAILGIGAIEVKPVRRAGSVEFIDAIGLSLTCDHQVIDGAPGARFLAVVKEQIESVERLIPETVHRSH